MKITLARNTKEWLNRTASTLVEMMIGVALLAIVTISLFGGMSSGFAVTESSRENLRATQIILERMEGLRLFNWNQLVYSNWIPRDFTSSYYPMTKSGESSGITYYGQMTINPVNLDPVASYSTNMRAVTVTLRWTAAGVPRSRSLTTYVSRDGIQNYVYAGIGAN